MIKIFANQKIRELFVGILLSMLIFAVISALFMVFGLENAAFCIWLGSLCMCAVILLLCYRYFREQNRTMEEAAAQITEYISGNRDILIECNDEGELYRLFHEVNALVSILNAHAENEKRAKRFLKDIISDISHQLKTPLAALNIYNGILQEEAECASSVRDFVKLSEQELDRIETLVQNLLKIAKLDAGMICLEKSWEHISDLMKIVEKRFCCRAEQEGKELILSGSEEIIFFCDRSWLVEAVGNIVKNALDHTDKGGVIRIEWKTFASVVQIAVKDNGSGIHPEDLYYIFKRFYRSRFSKDTQGIGLGLPLAKAVVEAHNGTVEVDSRLGDGSVFTINLLAENGPEGCTDGAVYRIPTKL